MTSSAWRCPFLAIASVPWNAVAVNLWRFAVVWVFPVPWKWNIAFILFFGTLLRFAEIGFHPSPRRWVQGQALRGMGLTTDN